MNILDRISTLWDSINAFWNLSFIRRTFECFYDIFTRLWFKVMPTTIKEEIDSCHSINWEEAKESNLNELKYVGSCIVVFFLLPFALAGFLGIRGYMWSRGVLASKIVK